MREGRKDYPVGEIKTPVHKTKNFGPFYDQEVVLVTPNHTVKDVLRFLHEELGGNEDAVKELVFLANEVMIEHEREQRART